MKTTYGIALRNNQFLMVYNSKRNGWEMPGGKLEDGESFEEAVIREFYEETGLQFIPMASREITNECIVFAGKINNYVGQGEMIWKEFENIPCNLGFPLCEYEEQISWAKKILHDISGNH